MFAINDNVAYMVLRVADELGLKVPDELIQTGFDGMSIASISQPTITTIVQDSTAIADEASRLLVESIKKRGKKNDYQVLFYISSSTCTERAHYQKNKIQLKYRYKLFEDWCCFFVCVRVHI